MRALSKLDIDRSIAIAIDPPVLVKCRCVESNTDGHSHMGMSHAWDTSHIMRPRESHAYIDPQGHGASSWKRKNTNQIRTSTG